MTNLVEDEEAEATCEREMSLKGHDDPAPTDGQVSD